MKAFPARSLFLVLFSLLFLLPLNESGANVITQGSVVINNTITPTFTATLTFIVYPPNDPASHLGAIPDYSYFYTISNSQASNGSIEEFDVGICAGTTITSQGSIDDGNPLTIAPTSVAHNGVAAYLFTNPISPGSSSEVLYITSPNPPGGRVILTLTSGGTSKGALTRGTAPCITGGFDSNTASIGDTIFNDLNANGIEDSGEPGIGGVTIDLLNSSGSIIATLMTNSQGKYSFDMLPAGAYTVDVTDLNNVLSGFFLTTANEPFTVFINVGITFNDADFGYHKPLANASIGDKIFNDLNGNGLEDPGEPGIAQVTINLLDSGSNVIDTKTTDTNGNYHFLDLPAGTYTVDVTDTDGVLTNYVLTTGNEPLSVTVAESENFDSADFGYRLPTGSIGDLVFEDLDGNGIQDQGDPGISGVTIDLLDLNNTVVDSAITDQNGFYDFTGVIPGNYIVDVTDLNSVLFGFLLTTNNEPLTVSLSPGQDFNDADFGYQKPLAPASIGDTVFDDTNGNGIQDQGELGIGGVTINLLDSSGTLFATAITDQNGFYDFANIPPASYVVDVTDIDNVLADYILTTNNEPLPVTVSPGEDFNNADFGYQKPIIYATIGDTVFHDINGNGIQDQGELGIANVTLALLDSQGGIFKTAVTDINGFYDFTEVPAGSYTVDVTDLNGVLTNFILTTLNEPLPVTVIAGDDFNSADFGYIAFNTDIVCPKTIGFWRQQVCQTRAAKFTKAEIDSIVALAVKISTVFNSSQDLIASLKAKGKCGPLARAKRQLAALALNLAANALSSTLSLKIGLAPSTPLNLSLTTATTVGEAFNEVESYISNGTKLNLAAAIADSINNGIGITLKNCPSENEVECDLDLNDDDFDHDGKKNDVDSDRDNDGIKNISDSDDDNDGIGDDQDLDDDNDGVLDECDPDHEDRCGEGINDDDFDNDGINNILDKDDDNDRICDNKDPDDDNDGLPDIDDDDDDNDGLKDLCDPDHKKDHDKKKDPKPKKYKKHYIIIKDGRRL